MARRGKKTVTGNVQKYKQLKKRPDYLRQQSKGTGGQVDSEDEDDWEVGLSVTISGQQDQERCRWNKQIQNRERHRDRAHRRDVGENVPLFQISNMIFSQYLCQPDKSKIQSKQDQISFFKT